MDRYPVSDDTEIAVLLIFRTGRYHIRLMNVDESLAQDLRDVAKDALRLVFQSRLRDYDPDAEQLSEECVVVPRDVLMDDALLDQIRRGATSDLLEDDYFRDHRGKVFGYALVLGPDGEDQTIFIRKTNPIQLNTKPIVGSRVNGIVRKLEEPILAFDRKIDVLVTNDRIIAINQSGFKRLFRDDDFVIRHVHAWIDKIFVSDRLPLAPEGLAFLQNRTRSNDTLRKKLESILRRPYMSTFTMENFRKALTDGEWDHDRFIVDGTILVNTQNELDLLSVLNDDPFRGLISGEYRIATSSRPRT